MSTTGQTSPTIDYRIEERVAIVTLDRPRYRNAQSRILLEELDDALNRAVRDPAVNVIVLRGAGDHFSSGHDVGTPEEMTDREQRPYAEGLVGRATRSWDLNVENTLRWRDLPKPTIAAVQGFCIFGGWMIASAMDLIVAADDARFLATHFQYFSVPWDLGARKTKELLWTADFIDADQACELGLVNRVVPRAELDQHTLELAHEIASKDRLLARMVKKSVNEMQDMMGYRTAISTAWSSYMLLQEANQLTEGQMAEQRRHPGVAATMGERPPEEDAGGGGDDSIGSGG